MTMFGSLVTDMQTKANGNGGRARGGVSDTAEMRTLLETVGRYINRKTKALEIRIADLETRMEQFQYCGVYQDGVTYKRGNFVTFGGSIWHCNCDTCVKPGVDQIGWVLAVKRGKNGKDAQ